MVVTASRPAKMWGVTDHAGDDLYIPKIAIIEDIIEETPDTKTFRLVFEDKEYAKTFSFEPGQFVEVTVFGAGEAPIGFASDPMQKAYFELTVVDRGKVTGAMCRLAKGEKVGVRGPLGNCWPLEAVKGMDLLIIGGGCGLAPLRPAIFQALANRKDYRELHILYGCRTPADRNFKYDLEDWARLDNLRLLETVDVAGDGWNQGVGVVTTLLDKIKIDVENTVAFTVGPPIMIKFVTMGLLKMGLSDDRIVTSLERYMKCGVGKCGHCCINHAYICTEGPVFTYKDLRGLPEARL